MNILIVGNGFDLSHYLPTKYDHFMDAMVAIEAKDIGGLPEDLENTKLEDWLDEIDKIFEKRKVFEPLEQQMSFDEIFANTRDQGFITKTREYYLIDQIQISAKDVVKLQYRLSLNYWYQYFKSHVKDANTWIDFEQKIENVLLIMGGKLFDLEIMDSESSFLDYFNGDNKNKAKVNKFDIKVLENFKLIVKDVKIRNIKAISSKYSNFQPIAGSWWNMNKNFCHGCNLENGFSASIFINYLADQLEDFIKIFDLYLELVVSQLAPNCLAEINSEDWVYPDKVYSFNYTNTFQRIHDSVDVDYLHGSHGQSQNIVLGISDIEDESLKKLKAYGFTKYHQKLFKDTDYLFLDRYKVLINENKKKLEDLDKSFQGDHRTKEIFVNDLNKDNKLDLNFYIWGHSLDISDKDYIIDLFSLNDDMDRNVRVTIFYFDKQAKFSLLNNLLAILGKDKVEQWMKNKWLKFKENPKIDFGISKESVTEQQAS